MLNRMSLHRHAMKNSGRPSYSKAETYREGDVAAVLIVHGSDEV